MVEVNIIKQKVNKPENYNFNVEASTRLDATPKDLRNTNVSVRLKV